MKLSSLSVAPLALAAIVLSLVPGCITEKDDSGTPIGGDGATADAPFDVQELDATDTGGIQLDGSPDAPAPVVSAIYATTNTELYKMDPSTKNVLKVGDFDFGAMTVENITDIAVNGNGDLWFSSEQHIFTAPLPTGGSGPVKLTLKLTLPTTSKFYALGFAPAGVLETGEGLVAGDSAGDLYYIPTTSPTPTLQKLGGFGACKTGDPSPCASGSVWQLSGDVVFYTFSGTPKGLATLRACVPKSGGSATCDNTNDIVAEIDMTALASKNPNAVLRKKLLGTGVNYGRTFGVGAWEDKIYGFTYASTGVPAQLIQVDSTGQGSLVQVFSSLTSGGWTGAGVSTKAQITVIQ
jgi:hypothetical protein